GPGRGAPAVDGGARRPGGAAGRRRDRGRGHPPGTARDPAEVRLAHDHGRGGSAMSGGAAGGAALLLPCGGGGGGGGAPPPFGGGANGGIPPSAPRGTHGAGSP